MSNKFWADPGPSLDEYPTNPNDCCFELVVTVEDYDKLLELLRLARKEGAQMMGDELLASIDAALSQP